jgi:hypothetical protein
LPTAVSSADSIAIVMFPPSLAYGSPLLASGQRIAYSANYKHNGSTSQAEKSSEW